MNCRYLKGSEHSPESVEFDTENTTCVVNVDLLLCGIKNSLAATEATKTSLPKSATTF